MIDYAWWIAAVLLYVGGFITLSFIAYACGRAFVMGAIDALFENRNLHRFLAFRAAKLQQKKEKDEKTTREQKS